MEQTQQPSEYRLRRKFNCRFQKPSTAGPESDGNLDSLELGAAQVSAGLRPGMLTLPEEKKLFSGNRNEYLEARNFVLMQWCKDKTRFLSEEEVLVAAKAQLESEGAGSLQPDLLQTVYRFLHKQGLINCGLLKMDPNIPSKSAIRDRLYAMLNMGEVDLSVTSAKMVRSLLGKHFGIDLSDKKALIGSLIDDYLLDRKQSEEYQNGESKRESKGKQSNPKVIVIGAGPAGLAAALHLQRHGKCSVTILEARDRVGGRVFSHNAPGFSCPVDLGASIITGTVPDVGNNLPADPSSLVCSQLGIGLHQLGSGNDALPLYDAASGKKFDAEVDAVVEKLRDEILDDVADALDDADSDPQQFIDVNTMCLADLIDASMKKRLLTDNENSETLRLLHWHWANLEYGCSAPLSAVSAAHWNQDEVYGGFGGPHCMVIGGYDGPLKKMAACLGPSIVKLSCPVHHVAIMNNNKVRVSYSTAGIDNNKDNEDKEDIDEEEQTLECDAVIVTVPLGVLKAISDTAFDPPLPQWKQDAIHRLGFGNLNKIILEFPAVFWDDSVDYFGAVGDKDGLNENTRGWCFMFWNFHRFCGAPVLAALVSGQAAHQAESMSDDQLKEKAMEALRRINPTMATTTPIPDPVACVVSRWGSEPFSKGSYSYVAVGASGDDYDVLAMPVGRRILFAGEHTVRQHPDTVGGAMLSGIREAARVIELLETEIDDEPFVGDIALESAGRVHEGVQPQGEVLEAPPRAVMGIDVERMDQIARNRAAAREASKGVWRAILAAEGEGEGEGGLAMVHVLKELSGDAESRVMVVRCLLQASERALRVIARREECMLPIEEWVLKQFALDVEAQCDGLRLLSRMWPLGVKSKSTLKNVILKKYRVHPDAVVRKVVQAIMTSMAVLGNDNVTVEGKKARTDVDELDQNAENPENPENPQQPMLKLDVKIDEEAARDITKVEEEAKRLEAMAKQLAMESLSEINQKKGALDVHPESLLSFDEYRKHTEKKRKIQKAQESNDHHTSTMRDERKEKELHFDLAKKTDALVSYVLSKHLEARRITKEQYKSILRKVGDKVMSKMNQSDLDGGRATYDKRKKSIIALTEQYVAAYTR